MRLVRWGLILTALFLFLIVQMGCGSNESNSPVDEGRWVTVDANLAELREIQEEVDRGHRPGLLDPLQCAMEFVNSNLGLKGKIENSEVIDNQEMLVRMEIEGRTIELKMFQPVRKDETGIWAVEKYRYLEEKPQLPVKEDQKIKVTRLESKPGLLEVEGIAQVYEATVNYEITDSEGDILYEGYVTASEGAPGWGKFELSIAGDLEEASILSLFTLSAEDGRRAGQTGYFIKPFGEGEIMEVIPSQGNTQYPENILVKGTFNYSPHTMEEFMFSIMGDAEITDLRGNKLQPGDLETGDKVTVWLEYPGLIRESMPPGADVRKIMKQAAN